MSKLLAAKTLVAKVEKIVKARMSEASVVSFKELKSLRLKNTPRLLIIEDDVSIRKSLIRIFTDESYHVTAVEDGTQLGQVADQFVYDLILLDVNLPWLNGFELCELMKEHKDLKEIPLVFISGQDDIESIKKGFAVGASDYIKKPFDILKVKKTVRTLLELNQ